MSIFVTRSSMPEFDEYIEEIKPLWESRWLTNMGEKHEAFKEALCKYLEVEKLDLLTNGHMALELSLQALGLKGEVITTPFTFASTTHAIIRNGLQPVFCDIKEDDYTLDVSKLEALITDNTCAILPVHVYGNICQVEEIERLAHKYGLKVIYDAAHAFGVRYKGKSIASYGDISCYSFHATKVFHSVEGGAAIFKDEEIGKKLYNLKNFGIKDQENVEAVGANAKMNELCAAMGLCNLRHLGQEIKRRKRVAEIYWEGLANIEGLKLHRLQEGIESNYAYFPILVDERACGVSRNEIASKLAQKDIFVRKYFYPLTNTFACFHGQYDVQATPVALHISKRILTLPIYADLSEEEAKHICDEIISIIKAN